MNRRSWLGRAVAVVASAVAAERQKGAEPATDPIDDLYVSVNESRRPAVLSVCSATVMTCHIEHKIKRRSKAS